MKNQNTRAEIVLPNYTTILGPGYPMPALIGYRRGRNRFLWMQNTMFPPYRNPQPTSFALFPKDHDLLLSLKVAFSSLVTAIYSAISTFPDQNVALMHTTEMPVPVRNHLKRHDAWMKKNYPYPCCIEAVRITDKDRDHYYFSLNASQIYPPKRKFVFVDKLDFVSLSVAACWYNEAVRNLFAEDFIIFPCHLFGDGFEWVPIVHGLPPYMEGCEI